MYNLSIIIKDQIVNQEASLLSI